MKLLNRAQLRFLRFAPWSTLTVLLGLTLAVSSIVAVHQISQRVVNELNRIKPPYLQAISVLLEKPGLEMAHYFDLRARWRAGEVPAMQGLMPLVEGMTVLDGRSVRIVGLDAFSGIPETLGLALLPADAFVAGVDSGYTEGDRFSHAGRSYRVAHVLDSLPRDLLITDIGTAQVMLGLEDTALSRVAAVISAPTEQLAKWSERLLPGFSAGISLDSWRLPGWQVRSLDSELPSLTFARSVLFNLGALGSLALVVSWLLVYQVGVIWLRRRQQTLLRLRQMGVSDRELRSSFLWSLSGLGLLASGIGLIAGDLLAGMLVQAVTGYGDTTGVIDSRMPAIDGWLVVKAVGSAVLVSLLGGWLAFARELHPAGGGRRTWMVSGLVALTGSAGVLASDTLLGGFVAIAAVSVLVLGAIRPLLEWLREYSRHVGGRLLARVGLRELVWYPGDLAVAVAALTLALATSIAIALMVDSFRQDFAEMLDRRMIDDLFVEAEGQDLAGLAAMLRARPDVQRVQAYGRTERVIAGHRAAIGFTRFDALESGRYGLDRSLTSGECLISERLARTLGLEVGDGFQVGSLQLVVAGIFAGYGDPVPRVLLQLDDASAAGLLIRYDRLSIRTRSPRSVLAALETRNPELTVEERHVMRATALEIFDRTFAITRALTFLAVIVASAALYNALLALQLLQQRPRELLHAMGVSRAELKSVERWRVIGVGAAAIGFALPLGLVMGWLLCRVINPRAFGWSIDLLVSGSSLLWPILSALGVMALVALLPTPVEGLADEG